MEAYRIVNRRDSRSLVEYLTENGQILLPMVELIDVLGWASSEGCAGVVSARSRRGQAAGPEEGNGALVGIRSLLV